MLEPRFARERGHAAGIDHGDSGNKPHHEEQAQHDAQPAVNEDRTFSERDHERTQVGLNLNENFVSRCVLSRGAAIECSPGRKPGVFFRDDLSPVGAKDSFAPTGLVCQNDTYPGLAPGATLCRRSAPVIRMRCAIFGHPYFFVFSNDSMSPGLRSILSTAPI